MVETSYGKVFPIDACFENSVDRLQKVVAVRLNVKPYQIGAEQSVYQFAPPWGNIKCLRGGPGDVPEDCHPGLRSSFLDQPRQEGEVIVLDQDNRLLHIFHFFQQRVGELKVNLLIAFPVLGAKNWASVGNVTERPESLVGKTVVITLFFRPIQPDPTQSVARVFRRHAQAIVRIDRFEVGIATAMGYPGSVTDTKDRLNRSNHPAGRYHD